MNIIDERRVTKDCSNKRGMYKFRYKEQKTETSKEDKVIASSQRCSQIHQATPAFPTSHCHLYQVHYAHGAEVY